MKRIDLKENSYFHTDGTHGISFDTSFGKVSITARSRAFKAKFAEGKSDTVEAKIKKDGITSCYRKSFNTPESAKDTVDHLTETAGQNRLDLFIAELKRIGFQAVPYLKQDWEEDIFQGNTARWSFERGGSSTINVSNRLGAVRGIF